MIAAGSPQQVADAMKEAEQFREPLLERGVLVIPLPIYEGNAAPPEENGAGSTESSDDQTKSNLRYTALYHCCLELLHGVEYRQVQVNPQFQMSWENLCEM